MRAAFVGGGTLGSVTPLLAVAQAVRDRQPAAEIYWIGTDSGPEERLVREAGLDFESVSSGKFRRYLAWRNVTDIGRIIKGFFECWSLFGRRRPDALVSAGSFVAVPAVWAAWCRRIPVHLHQMDIRPGLANKLSAPFAGSFSVAFEKSLRDFSAQRPVWTGNPVRPELFQGSRTEAGRLFGLEAGVPTVLVLGGGTGAVSLNDLARLAVPEIAATAQLIHLTGRGKSAPAAGPSRYHQIEFLTGDMKHAYAAADLVVTRAGMGVLTELAALGKPAVIVPMPGSHQEENAAFFAGPGAAVVLAESGLGPRDLAAAVLGLLGDPDRLQAMGEAMSRFNRSDSAERLADLVLGLVGGAAAPS